MERAAWAAWEVESNLTPRVYTRAVTNAGAQAVILPPDDLVAQAPDEALVVVRPDRRGLGAHGPGRQGAGLQPDLVVAERARGVTVQVDPFEVLLERPAQGHV